MRNTQTCSVGNNIQTLAAETCIGTHFSAYVQQAATSSKFTSAGARALLFLMFFSVFRHLMRSGDVKTYLTTPLSRFGLSIPFLAKLEIGFHETFFFPLRDVLFRNFEQDVYIACLLFLPKNSLKFLSLCRSEMFKSRHLSSHSLRCTQCVRPRDCLCPDIPLKKLIWTLNWPRSV